MLGQYLVASDLHNPCSIRSKETRATVRFYTKNSLREASTSLILTTAFLCGCVTLPTIRPVTEDQWDTSALRGRSLALYRITAEIAAETVTRPPYRLELVDIKTNEVDSLHVFSTSQESSDEGWGYFLVKPGLHRLSLTFLFFGYPSADFQLSVRSGQSIIYVGSLSIQCRREPVLLFILITDCSAIIVSDETPAAEALATVSFGRTRPLSTRLLRAVQQR
jgi:hypothetical protein